MTAGWDRRQWSVLLVTCTGLFVTQFDLTVVNVAMDSVQTDFAASTTAVTWVVDAYFVTFAACMIGFGDIGDLLGRRMVFLVGLAGFACASAACALAPTAGWLIGFRAAQGVAGAAVLVSSLAILAAEFADADAARAVGTWSAAAGTALVAGPVVGGVLVEAWGWPSVFWINVPICAVALAAGLMILPEARPGRDRGLDVPGQVLAVAVLGTLAWGLSQTAGSRGSSVAGWASIAAAVLLGVVLGAVERRSAAPLVPPELVAAPLLRGANAAALLVNFGTLGLLYLLSLSFQRDHGLSAAAAGLRIAPLFASYALVSLVAGRIVGRWGARRAGAGGCLLAAAGVAVLPRLTDPGFTTTPVLVVVGLGVGLALPAFVATAVAAVPAARAGLASGLNNTSRQIGGTLGVAVLGGIVVAAESEAGGIRTALVVDALGYLLAGTVAWRALPPRSHHATTRSGSASATTGAVAGTHATAAATPGQESSPCSSSSTASTVRTRQRYG